MLHIAAAALERKSHLRQLTLSAKLLLLTQRFRFLPGWETSNHHAFSASPFEVLSVRPAPAGFGERGGNPGRRPGCAGRRHDALAACLGDLRPPAGWYFGDAR